MQNVLFIILKTVNPAIRPLFILFIGVRSIRSALTMDLDSLDKLVYLSDELALMFLVPIVFTILEKHSGNRLEAKQVDKKLVDGMQIIFSIFFYCLISLLNGFYNTLILVIGYISAGLCLFIMNFAKMGPFYRKRGPVFFGFFVYIVSLIIISGELDIKAPEQLFLLLILPRVAYGNIFRERGNKYQNEKI